MAPRTNIQRLREEGYEIVTQGLPPEYEDVIEGLDPAEVQMLIDVNRRLHRAQGAAQTRDAQVQPFLTFFPPL
jgi:hypothetical protein